MKYYLICLWSLILFTQSVMAGSERVTFAQPTSCVTSEFLVSGRSWNSVVIKLTNNCGQAVEFQNATVKFNNRRSVHTTFWGSFAPLPHPDNELIITSQKLADGNYEATLNLHFPTNRSSTKLPVGRSIQLKYGIKSDAHIGNAVVYLSENVNTGSLELTNATAKPANVSQSYALVHLAMNGQVLQDIQLAWAAPKTLTGLAAGNYTLALEPVSDSAGNSYQGTATPSSFSVAANAVTKSSINYALVQQIGKISINLQSLPSQLTGYTGTPSALLTQTQTGASISKTLAWNSLATVTGLKEGSAYQLSTGSISYNGFICAPIFTPGSQVANATTVSTSNLTFNCVQVAQDNITLNAVGDPAISKSLVISLKPNDSSATVSQTINLSNGTGSANVLLTNGAIYTLSSSAVAGYTISFSPQPLTATANSVETITLTPTNATPVSVNGQLKVCGTQLCNDKGVAIQLKGMSTHGLQWYGEGVCVTPASMDALSQNFKANVIRLSMYVQEDGYETNPTKFTTQVSNLINLASSRGMYVIVDWHMLEPGDPNYNLTRAKKFFTDIATMHKDKNNLLYEIANEPSEVSWATIKSYADQLIPVIRAIDPEAPILIGTRAWSSLGVSDGASYQEIVNNPVQFPNIMYTFHFYAASHGNEYYNALNSASQVLPIFVTEFGTQTYTGDGANNFTMSDKYMQLMASKKIGWTNWNYSDDFRSGAIWKTGTCGQGSWVDANLKPAGVYVKNKILNP